MAELLDRLKDYHKSDMLPLHMPGHKQSDKLSMEGYMDIDITEIDEFDNLHEPEPGGLLDNAMKKAANFYGSGETLFLVNGSTSGILIAISALCKKGDSIIFDRQSHRAAYHALYLRELEPIYLYPSVSEINGQVSVSDIKSAMEKNPHCKVVFITSPTYEGVVSDIKEIAKAVHDKDGVLIVDEAHGAHLGICDKYPETAIKHADVVIQSSHKTLPAMTQTALLHISREAIEYNRVSENSIKRFFNIYQTSSPSYVLMASIDEAIEYVKKEGKNRLEDIYSERIKLEKDLENLKKLEIFPRVSDMIDIGKYYDSSKLLVRSKDSRITGHMLYEAFRKELLQPEMATYDYVLLMLSMMDDTDTFDRIKTALIKLDQEYCSDYGTENNIELKNTNKADYITEKIYKSYLYRQKTKALSLFEAWDSDKEEIELENAANRVSYGFINLYPPGIPIVVPGEIIDEKTIESLKEALNSGLKVQGILGNNLVAVIKKV